MIIVSNKNTTNYVFFPRNLYEENSDIYKIMLKDRGSNKEYLFDNCVDEHLANIDYYTFALKFLNIPKGEYEYNIIDSNEKSVGTGLIRLKELVVENTEYNENITYEFYDKQ